MLQQGGGGPLGPGRRSERSGGGRRKGLIIGAAVGLAAIGAAAFGGYTWLTSTGPQPAEALPAGTLGYVSIDLDPSGSQKIAALKTLEKFPAAERLLDEEGISSGEDLRQVAFGKIQEEEGACEGLDFDDDIKPWLGDRFAMAAVDQGDETPAGVGVIQVKDGEDAQDRVESVIEECGGDPDEVGLAVSGDWLIIAETDDIAQQVADDAGDANLADDEDFQEWTDAAGDPGILMAYASPEAGEFIAEELSSLGGFVAGDEYDCMPGIDEGADPFTGDDFSEGCVPSEGLGEDVLPDEVTSMVEDFGGLAMTVRFDDGSLEVEMAGDTTALGLASLTSSGAGAEVVSTLPEDTAAAFGLGFEPGWFEEMIDYVDTMSGGELGVDEMLETAEDELGIALPEDVETLLGESAAVAVSADFDPETVFGEMSGVAQVPVGVKIQGDSGEIEEVLDKIRATAPTPEDAELLASESEGDHVVIGPNPDYLSELLEDGSLGDSDVYQDVVREDDPSGVFFVNFDAGDNWLANLAGEEPEVQENLEPLSGLGITGWEDDGVGHSVWRLTTD